MKLKLIFITLGLAAIVHFEFHEEKSTGSIPFQQQVPPSKLQESTYAGSIVKFSRQSASASAKEAIDRLAYQFDPKTGAAENQTFQMQIRSDKTGLTVTPVSVYSDKPEWTFSILNRTADHPSFEAEKTTYQVSPTAQEWFINSKKGIEHGMTLQTPPSSVAQPLKMEFRVSSDLIGVMESENHLVFKNAEGTPTLRYQGLFAFDAKGRDIPTALAWNEERSTISWQVDHKGYDYPITIDPIIATFSQRILSERNGSDFGDSLAIQDDFMAASDGGRVYLFERKGGTWEVFSRKNRIESPATNGRNFARFILMPDRDTIITADTTFDAPNATGGTNVDQGTLFIFGRDIGGDNNWGLIRQFTITDPVLPSGALVKRLGNSIAYSNNLIAATAERSDRTAPRSIYLFEKDRGGLNNWGQIPGVRLESLNFASNSTSFGGAIQLMDDLLVVGSPAENFRANETSPLSQFQGAVYLYSRNQGGSNQWGLLHRRYAPDGAFGDFFGNSVSIEGDLIAVGARGRDLSPSLKDTGSVYFLSRNVGGENNWGVVPTQITAPDAAADDLFGTTVSLKRNVLAVSSPSDDVAGVNDAGSLYLFERSSTQSTSWTPIEGGKFSIDNIPGISAVLSPVSVSTNHVAISTSPGSIVGAIVIINIFGNSATPPPGQSSFNRDGILSYVPLTTGTFQLRTTTNLTTWANQGNTVAGTGGSLLTFDTGTPVPGGTRFFRVERQ